MALTTQIAAQTLKTGEATAVTTLVSSDERVTLVFTATAVTTPSKCRLVVRDDSTHVKSTQIIDDSGVKKVTLEAIDGSITLQVECFLGSATVKVETETGLEGSGNVETADLADGILSADAAGRLKMADGFIQVGKLAAGALTADATGLAKMADGFLSADAAGRAKMADAFVTTAKIGGAQVTPAKLVQTGMKHLRFDGRNGAGAITLTGSAVGDRVLFILGVISATGVSVVGTIPTQFEATISVVDQIQQADAGDLSGNDYWVVLIPASA